MLPYCMLLNAFLGTLRDNWNKSKNILFSFLVYFMENEEWLQLEVANKKSRKNLLTQSHKTPTIINSPSKWKKWLETWVIQFLIKMSYFIATYSTSWWCLLTVWRPKTSQVFSPSCISKLLVFLHRKVTLVHTWIQPQNSHYFQLT